MTIEEIILGLNDLKTDAETHRGADGTIWNNFRDVSFVIRNEIAGAYIHESLMKIMEFSTHDEAMAFIRRRNLNRDIYFVEVGK